MKKRNFLYLCITAIVAFAFCGCNNDEEDLWIYEWYPISFGIYVQDEAGNNLLDESVANNILSAPIAVEYKGKVHSINKKTAFQIIDEQRQTRALFPYFTGLTSEVDKTGAAFIQFGEIDGGGRYQDDTFIITWGDGTSDTFTFSRKFKGKGKNIKAIDTVKLNGKKCDLEFVSQADNRYNFTTYKIVIVK